MSSNRSRPRGLRGERGYVFRDRLARRDGKRCFYCRSPFASTADATLDHFLPYVLWRSYARYNLVLACEPCNTAKGSALPLGLLLLLRTPVRRDELGVAA